MNKTSIPWTDYTWNPVTGCTPISEGCEHCYCRAMEKRFKWPTAVMLHPERLKEPVNLNKPSKIFVCSMSDLFHPDVPDEFIVSVFTVMVTQQRHTFQILTKRPELMRALMGCLPPKLRATPNVWLGVTAENQVRADERIPLLLQVPAAVRFVSIEPMLSAITLRPFLPVHLPVTWVDGPRLNWVIAGCESGPGRRPMQPCWARTLRDQCQAAGVPFFLKSMTDENGDAEALPELEGRQWLEFPEVRL